MQAKSPEPGASQRRVQKVAPQAIVDCGQSLTVTFWGSVKKCMEW